MYESLVQQSLELFVVGASQRPLVGNKWNLVVLDAGCRRRLGGGVWNKQVEVGFKERMV